MDDPFVWHDGRSLRLAHKLVARSDARAAAMRGRVEVPATLQRAPAECDRRCARGRLDRARDDSDVIKEFVDGVIARP